MHVNKDLGKNMPTLQMFITAVSLLNIHSR